MNRNRTSGRAAAVARTSERMRATGAVVLALLLALAAALSAAPADARPAPDSFADLAEKLSPAVVNISSTQVVQGGPRPEIPQAPPGSPFEDFFKEFFDRNQRGIPQRATSLGSGFIIDSEGLVVTNNHVIGEADEITVTLHDDRSFKAEVVGKDSKTDLALLRIKTDAPLPSVSWGDSAASRVGDWVIAIGNPFGLGGTVTAGIISARQRDINQGPYDAFIQTDASINRGNSGGPMFNMDGQVIGVNTAIFSPTGGSVGVGFAVPSSIAQQVIDQIREYGHTRRGWLGVKIQSVTDDIAENIGLDKARGALVAGVSKDGPAEEADIRPGDVILTFDGKPVQSMRELPRIVAETQIGKSVKVDLWRKDRRETVDVKVGLLDEEEAVLAATTPDAEGPQPAQAEIDDLGISVTSITDEMRSRFGVSDDVRGVVVTGVRDGSSAAEKNLQPGDVISEVNQEAVSTPGQIAEKVQEARDAQRQTVLLRVSRDGDHRFVAVRIGKS